MWLKNEVFKDQVERWWRNCEISGTRSFILMEKMKALKTKIRVWNKEVFGGVDERKKVALKKLARLDEIEIQRLLNFGRIGKESGGYERFEKVGCFKINISWRQKSWEIWIKGDENTCFFFFIRWQIPI